MPDLDEPRSLLRTSPGRNGSQWGPFLSRPGQGWLAAVLLICVAGLATLPRRDMGGLPLYVLTAQRMRQGEAIYRPERITEQFTYPPLFALPFIPLTQLPEPAQRGLWYLLNCAALLLIVCCLEKRLRPALVPARVPGWVYWSLVVVLAGRHVLSALENQSHDLLLLLCVMLAIDALCGARGKTAGVWAGLGAALKVVPLLFAPLFVWQRRWLSCLTLMGSLAVLSILPDLLYPAKDGTCWLCSWYTNFLQTVHPGQAATSAAWTPWNQLNQSLAGTIYRLFSVPNAAKAGDCDVCLWELDRTVLRGLTMAAQLAVLVGLWWFTRRRRGPSLPEGERGYLALGEGAALVTAVTLLSPMSSKSLFCMLLLPTAFCLADFLHRRRDGLTGLALVLTLVLGTLTVKDVVGRDLGNRLMACGSITGCALVLFLATGRVLRQRSRAIAGATVGRTPLSVPALDGQERPSHSSSLGPARGITAVPHRSAA